MKQRLVQLDRIAAQMNALLLVIALGLGVLDLTVLIGKGMSAAIAQSMTVPANSDAGQTQP
jgi:hypothetical protein